MEFTCHSCRGKFDRSMGVEAAHTVYCPNCYSWAESYLDAMSEKIVIRLRNDSSLCPTKPVPNTPEQNTRWYMVLFSHYSNVDVRWDYARVYYRARNPQRAAAAAVGRLVHRWQHHADTLRFARGNINVLVTVYDVSLAKPLYSSTAGGAWQDVRAMEPSWLCAEPAISDDCRACPTDGC